MYLPPGNEKLEIWQKIFVADYGIDQNSMYPPPHHEKDVDGTRMEHEYKWARDGTCTHDKTI